MADGGASLPAEREREIREWWRPSAAAEPGSLVSYPKASADIEWLLSSLASWRARAEAAEAALAFYADPYTYEMVDILGRCPLGGDRDEADDFGALARRALAVPRAPEPIV